MSLLNSVREKYKTPLVGTDKTDKRVKTGDKGASVSFVSSRNDESENLTSPADEARAVRRRRALASLGDSPETVRFACVPDTSRDPVMLTMAVRDIPTPGDITVCELMVPGHRYDPFAVLAVLGGDRPEGD